MPVLENVYKITTKKRRKLRRPRRRTVGIAIATPAVAIAGLAGLGFAVGPDAPAHATEHVVQNNGWIPSWVVGAHCTKGEAAEFGVSVKNCMNIVGTRQTITLTNDGVMHVHYS
jgi:hypothetical protein